MDARPTDAPPSTNMVCPVIKAASVESRNSTAAAISSGFSQATHWDSREIAGFSGAARRIVRAKTFGLRWSRRDSVDGDAALRKLQCPGSCEADQSSFRRCVARALYYAENGQAGNVDDARPAAARFIAGTAAWAV